jgi:hypothetical protein
MNVYEPSLDLSKKILLALQGIFLFGRYSFHRFDHITMLAWFFLMGKVQGVVDPPKKKCLRQGGGRLESDSSKISGGW